MLYKVLAINLVGLYLCSGQKSTIYLNLVWNGSTVTCEDAAATVLEGEPLKIQVKYDKNKLFSIRCTHGTSNYLRQGWHSDHIDINRVSLYMGSIWKCTILKLLETKRSQQRTETCGGRTCESIDCTIKIHLRRKEAPQVVLVNSMLLPSTPAGLRAPHDALAEYTYNDGDLVDVTCANPWGQFCHLQMSYNDDKISDMNQYPVGFRLRMRAGNDNTYAICTCEMKSSRDAVPDDTSTVRINFYMTKQAIANSINVYINGATLRPLTDKNKEYEYLYKKEDLQVTCESETLGDSVNMRSTPVLDNNYIYNGIIQNENNITLYLKLTYYSDTLSIYCATTNDEIMITLNRRKLREINGECSLRVELTHRNGSTIDPAIELYNSYNRDITYKYKDDDMFYSSWTGTCPGTKFEMPLTGSDNNTMANTYAPGADNANSIHKNISVSEISDGKVLQCSLKNKYTKGILLVATLVFVHYVPDTSATTTTTIQAATTTPAYPGKKSTTTATTVQAATTTPAYPGKKSPTLTTAIQAATTTPAYPGDNTISWILPLFGSVSSVFTICAIFAYYCNIKYRTDDRSNQQVQPSGISYENLPKDSPIPPFPRQWDSDSHYTVPTGKVEIPTFYPKADKSNPLLVPTANKEPASILTDNTDKYTDDDPPIVGMNAINDIQYAELIHNNSREQVKFNSNDDSPNYAQVLVRSVRKKERGNAHNNVYANAHDAQNIYANVRSARAEPTYLIREP